MRLFGITTACFAALIALPAFAQQPLPRPGAGAPPAPGAPAAKQPPTKGQPQQPQQPAAAPPAPYTPLAFTEPKPLDDPSFAEFRKQLAAVAQKKDRKALAGLVLVQGFFWFKGQGDAAKGKKAGIDHVAAALNLAAKDGSGWETLADFANEETAMPFPEKQGVVCAPAGPQFKGEDLEKLAQETKTDIGDWGYTAKPDIEVRAQPQADAPVIEKLGMHFVRVMMDPQAQEQTEWVRVVTPAGKVGFVSSESVLPLGGDQLCYVKDGSGAWKIAGVIGGE